MYKILKKTVTVLMTTTILFLGLFVFSQEEETLSENLKTIDQEIINETNQENQDQVNVSFDSLHGFYFCNDKETPKTRLDMVTSPGKENEICLYFWNNSDQDITIETEFSKGTITNLGAEACGIDGGDFIKTISKDRDNEFVVPANNTVIKTAKITFPITTQGKTHGCFAYSVKEDENKKKEGNSMFNVKFRKGYLIRAFVGDIDMDGKNQTIIENLKVKKGEEKNEIVVRWDVENKGIMDSKITVKGEIKNIFGFKQNFEITGLVLNVSEKKSIASTVVTKIIIPNYKLLYNVNLKMDREPFVENLDISSLNIDPKFFEGGSMNLSGSYFEMSRNYLIIAIVVIILIMLAFRKKKAKVVYVEKK